VATKRNTQRGSGRSTDEPHLRVPLAEAQKTLQARIEAGRQLLLATDRSGVLIPDMAAKFELLHNQFYTWEEYNYEWLKRNIGQEVATQSRSSFIVGSPNTIMEQIRYHNRDVNDHIRQLESVIERLPLWADEPAPAATGTEVDISGPIFVVHGHNHGRAQEVARVIEKTTGRDAIILHEQPNKGRTLIEKFEAQAGSASFAVVILTGDDEGRKAGSADLIPRGRQNVIFELGFFFGMLGRSRVAVLVDSGVEHPSDVAGLVYIELDGTGAWKKKLVQELEAAEIAVNYSKVP